MVLLNLKVLIPVGIFLLPLILFGTALAMFAQGERFICPHL